MDSSSANCKALGSSTREDELTVPLRLPSETFKPFKSSWCAEVLDETVATFPVGCFVGGAATCNDVHVTDSGEVAVEIGV